MSERRVNEVIQKITGSSIQSASPWHPQPQEYQGQHLSRDGGISCSDLLICLSSLSVCFCRILFQTHFFKQCSESRIGANAIK